MEVGCRSLFTRGGGEARIQKKKSEQNDTMMNGRQNVQHQNQSVNVNICKFHIQNSEIPPY